MPVPLIKAIRRGCLSASWGRQAVDTVGDKVQDGRMPGDYPGSMVKRLAILLALFAVAASPAPSAPSSPKGVDGFFADTDTDFFNGGVLIAKGREALVQRTSGFADFKSGARLNRLSVFQLASASKPFTSVAVLQLKDRGLLRLDDPVAKYLTGFPYPDITVRNLLTHTSGLPDLELFEPMIAKDPGHVVIGDDLLPALIAWKKPLRFPPGTQFRYSNINYQLLARMVATISHQPFGDYLRDHVFRPAGMRSSYVLGSRALGQRRAPVRNHAHAVMFQRRPEDVKRLHYPDPILMRPYRYEGYNLGSTVGDQNVFSTLDDLVSFDRALRSDAILSRASQLLAYAPLRFNNGEEYREPGIYDLYGAECSYGMGWEVCRHPTRGRLVGHAGYNRGIATIFYRELDSGVVGAMFDNGDTIDFAKKFASLVNIAHREAPLEVDRRGSAARALGDDLITHGRTMALRQFEAHRADAKHWAVTKGGMNRLGYDLLRNGYPALALEPFRLNIALYPQDATTFDSFGEALAANGRRDEAIQMYKRSLALQPDNPKGAAALRKLEEGDPAPRTSDQ